MELSEIATAAVGGGLSWQLVLMMLRRGQAAESKLEERIEGGLTDHKAKLEAIPAQLGAVQERLARLEAGGLLVGAALVALLLGAGRGRGGSK